MSQAVLTFVFLALLVVGAAGVAAVVHVAVRPGPRTGDASDALRELEPRGGRHRFHTRMFEVALLGCAWFATLAVLGVASLSPTGLGTPLVVTAASLVLGATWWAWRRGVFRAPAADRGDVHG
jgi:hypothetical protein